MRVGTQSNILSSESEGGVTYCIWSYHRGTWTKWGRWRRKIRIGTWRDEWIVSEELREGGTRWTRGVIGIAHMG